jgi:nucleoside-diphosphate-sugar epimerase
VGLDLVPPHDPLVNFQRVDITSEESVELAFDYIKKTYGTRLASFIHLAAYYQFSGDPSEIYEKITLEGTIRLLKNAKRLEIDPFVFSSTILLQAPCELGQKISEKWPLVPQWAHPESKVKTEKVIHELKNSIPRSSLSNAGCYDDQCHSISLSHQIQRIFEHQVIAHLFSGNPQHGASFLRLDDLANAFF